MVIGFDPVRVLSHIARRLMLARDLKFLVNYVVGAHRIGGHEQNENVAGPKVGLDLVVPFCPAAHLAVHPHCERAALHCWPQELHDEGQPLDFLAARLFRLVRMSVADEDERLGRCVTSELWLSSIRQRLLAFAPMVIVSRHGAQLAFVGIFAASPGRVSNGTKICAINRSLSVTPCSAQNRASSTRSIARVATIGRPGGLIFTPILGGWLRPSSDPIVGPCMKSPMTRPCQMARIFELASDHVGFKFAASADYLLLALETSTHA